MNGKRYSFLTPVCLLLLSFSIECATSGTDERLTDRTNDLKRLGHWVLIERSLTAENRAETLELIESWLESPIGLSDAEFFLQVASVAGRADNGHSNLGTAPIYDRFGLVPIRTYWFSDGLYIVRAQNRYRHLLGARIDMIAGIPVNDLAVRMKTYVGGTMAIFRQYFSIPYFLSPPILHAAGISEGERSLTISLTLADETELTVALDTDHEDSNVDPVSPWRYLVNEPIKGEDDNWATFVPKNGTPFGLQDAEKIFRIVPMGNGDVVYIQFRGNSGSDDQSIEDFTAMVSERLVAERPRAIIFDNRFNGGGDLTLTADFGLSLPSLTAVGGKVYVLTGNATFSAGIYTAFAPKAADSRKTVIVGEQVGDRTRFWAESWQEFRLPDSGFRLSYALQLHDLANGCMDREICHITYNENWNIAIGSFELDMLVPTTFGDFSAGRDPVLEAVMRRISK